MKVFISIAILCFISCAFAQLNSGKEWEGTWSENKRNFGGNLYICVNGDKAYGSYSGAGVFAGTLVGNRMLGEWYEAGYNTPFGSFSLSILGNTFSGTWNYHGDNATFSWNGLRSSNSRPSASQCLVPAPGVVADGTFEKVEHVCVSDNTYQNTNEQLVNANFEGFGTVAGYTPNAGSYLLLSNFFIVPGEVVDDYRPENNPAIFGPCSNCDYNNDNDDPSFIQTSRIGIAAMINDRQLCGFFWDGFYNDQIGSDAICFDRTSTRTPDSFACGSFATFQIPFQHDLGNTELILSEVQSVLDNIELPDVVILSGNIIDDDDEDFPPSYFTKFITTIPDDDDDDNGDVVYVPVKVPTPVPVPVAVPVPEPVPVPVPVPYYIYVYNGGVDDDDNNGGVDDDDNNGGVDDDDENIFDDSTSDALSLTASFFTIIACIAIFA